MVENAYTVSQHEGHELCSHREEPPRHVVRVAVDVRVHLSTREENPKLHDFDSLAPKYCTGQLLIGLSYQTQGQSQTSTRPEASRGERLKVWALTVTPIACFKQV